MNIKNYERRSSTGTVVAGTCALSLLCDILGLEVDFCNDKDGAFVVLSAMTSTTPNDTRSVEGGEDGCVEVQPEYHYEYETRRIIVEIVKKAWRAYLMN